MPKRSPKPCCVPGCPNLAVSGSFCDEHRRVADRRRGSSAERGYDARWRKLRKMFLRENPICGNPYGLHDGRTVPATEVDHIVPKRAGGTDDRDNLQALCKSCHSHKTMSELNNEGSIGRSSIPCTVIVGPPGSGKTTYVRDQAKWGDLILDMDALYHALSGLPWYEKPDCLLPFVAEARDAIIRRLSRPSSARRAWVITACQSRDQVERMAGRLGAELVVLDVSANECIRRISKDARRSDKIEHWIKLVNEWHESWRVGL